jgi:hypothetical protein
MPRWITALLRPLRPKDHMQSTEASLERRLSTPIRRCTRNRLGHEAGVVACSMGSRWAIHPPISAARTSGTGNSGTTPRRPHPNAGRRNALGFMKTGSRSFNARAKCLLARRPTLPTLPKLACLPWGRPLRVCIVATLRAVCSIGARSKKDTSKQR